jgi:hypothetical protein
MTQICSKKKKGSTIEDAIQQTKINNFLRISFKRRGLEDIRV